MPGSILGVAFLLLLLLELAQLAYAQLLPGKHSFVNLSENAYGWAPGMEEQGTAGLKHRQVTLTYSMSMQAEIKQGQQSARE